MQITQSVLCLWIALLVFRSRTTAAWITLIAAILSPLLFLTRLLFMNLFNRSWAAGPDRFYEISQALAVGYGVASLTFAVGLLLHLQRRKLESDRIADLEAILHDLQHRPADASPQPPK